MNGKLSEYTTTPSQHTKRVELSKLKLTAEDDPRQRPTYAALKASIAAAGDCYLPLVVTKDGDIIDGNTRYCAKLDLGHVDGPVSYLPENWSEADVLKFSIATDGVRRKLPIEELAIKAERYVQITGCTQGTAAKELGISAGYLSRALGMLLLPEQHREKTKALPGSIRAILAAISNTELQAKAVEFATTQVNNKYQTREAVRLFIERNQKPKGGAKQRTLKGKIGPHSFSIEFRTGDLGKDLTRSLNEIIAKLSKYQDAPAESIGFLFR